MNVLVMMLIVSLALAFGFLMAFLWANRQRQFDDLVSPAWRAILDDKDVSKEGEKHAEKL